MPEAGNDTSVHPDIATRGRGYVPAKYRKKPVVIEAMQWDGTAEGATPIIDWVLTGEHSARYHEAPGRGDDGSDLASIAIDTLEGTMHATPGDFVIRGVQGEFYPCKPSVFEATYDPADNNAA